MLLEKFMTQIQEQKLPSPGAFLRAEELIEHVADLAMEALLYAAEELFGDEEDTSPTSSGASLAE